jgi:transposase
MVVVLGTDVHKRSHTVVAVDQVGAKRGERVVAATDAGHAALLRWARQAYPEVERVWAVEDCRHLTARLERALLAAGERVVRVPPKLMAGARRGARTPGKSDPIDALAVARAALREPDLPVACHDQTSRELKLLVDHRESLTAERTKKVNRFRWHLHELDPERDPAPSALNRAVVREALAVWLQTQPGLVAELAAELLSDIGGLTDRINALEKRIAAAVAAAAPQLLDIPGCGALTAAKIVGETAGVGRFRSEACFAMTAGVAPIPVWSGNTAGRVRLNRGGNRQLNAALHRIAITQVRLGGLGRAYYDKRRATGDTSTEAYRALKRRLARTVFTSLKTTTTTTTAAQLPAAA